MNTQNLDLFITFTDIAKMTGRKIYEVQDQFNKAELQPDAVLYYKGKNQPIFRFSRFSEFQRILKPYGN